MVGWGDSIYFIKYIRIMIYGFFSWRSFCALFLEWMQNPPSKQTNTRMQIQSNHQEIFSKSSSANAEESSWAAESSHIDFPPPRLADQYNSASLRFYTTNEKFPPQFRFPFLGEIHLHITIRSGQNYVFSKHRSKVNSSLIFCQIRAHSTITQFKSRTLPTDHQCLLILSTLFTVHFPAILS